MSIWHRFQHRMGWFTGHPVSRTDINGRIFIGFMCDQCCKVTGEHDATRMIDCRIDARLIENAKRNPPSAGA